MKKMIFLTTPVLALLLAGCLSSGNPWMKIDGDSYAAGYGLINSKTPETLLGNQSRGVRLSLSPRASISIDVECILDYVQGDSVFTPEYETNDHLNPWFRFDYAY